MNQSHLGLFLGQIKAELLGLLQFRWVWLFNIMVMLKVRYRRSVLGFLWSMVGPFSSYAVIATVFYYSSGAGFTNFISHALPGFLMFNFLTAAMNNAPYVLIVNENYIRKIFLPKSVFFFSMVAGDFTNYFLAQLVVLAIAGMLGWLELTPYLLLLPVFWVLIFFFVLGVSLVVGTLTVFFRDIGHLAPIAMQIAFYATPVLYEISRMPPKLQFLMQFNPFLYFQQLYRTILFPSHETLGHSLEICAALALVSMVLGLVVLQRNNNKVVYFL